MHIKGCGPLRGAIQFPAVHAEGGAPIRRGLEPLFYAKLTDRFGVTIHHNPGRHGNI